VPFNLLLIPLVAGYLFLTEADLFAYSTSLLQKEQLLLRVSVVGLALAIVARVICFALVQSDIGVCLQAILHYLAPFPYMGTALVTLPLGYVAWKIINALVPANVAGDWLYHAGLLNQMESLLLRSAMGVPPQGRVHKMRLLWRQARRLSAAINAQPRSSGVTIKRQGLRLLVRLREARRASIFSFGELAPVMLTMSDNKVYVGFVSELPPVTGDGLQYVRLLPLWSGFRASETKEVFKVTSYIEAVRRVQDDATLLKVLRCSEISSASLFEDDLFDIPDARQRARRAQLPRRRIVRPRTRIV
jgi:hypothetical protein